MSRAGVQICHRSASVSGNHVHSLCRYCKPVLGAAWIHVSLRGVSFLRFCRLQPDGHRCKLYTGCKNTRKLQQAFYKYGYKGVLGQVAYNTIPLVQRLCLFQVHDGINKRQVVQQQAYRSRMRLHDKYDAYGNMARTGYELHYIWCISRNLAFHNGNVSEEIEVL